MTRRKVEAYAGYQGLRRKPAMWDIAFMALGLIFFLAGWLYLFACERL